MPPAVAGAVTAALITSGTSILVAQAIYAVAYVVTSVVVSVVLSSISKALQKKPRLPGESQFGGGSSGRRTMTFRDPVRARAVIYGQVRTGGAIVFAHTTESNKYLHLIITLAGHEVNEIGDILFNDAVVPLDGSGDATGKYAGFASVTKHLGAADQTVDSGLTTAASAKWTSNHRLRGIAYIYVKLTFSADLFPTGVPNISAVVKGREVYDARTSTTAWSANPALCLRDYLTDATYGLGLTAAEIDDTAFNAAANVCDEDVTLTAGGTEDRYLCNGVIDSDRRPRDVIQELLTSMAGIAVFTGGTWVAHAGAYRTPTVTLDEGDLRGPIAVQTRVSRRELFNRVKGLYVSPDNNWQPADFPSVVNATYKTQDNSEEIWKDINLPFTTSAATAQRLAKIELERARQQITVTLPCKLVAIELRAGDTVKITNARFGWTEKVFEVAEWAFALDSADAAPALGVDLVLRETASAVYDWSSGEETTVDAAPDTDLPDAFTVGAPTALTLTSGTTELDVRLDGTVFTRLKAAWTAPADEFVVSGGQIELQAKKSADSDWRPSQFIDGAVTAAWILDVQDGVNYDVRVRSINVRGVRSAYATATGHTVVGKTAAPADISSFSIDGEVLSWVGPESELDLAGYVIKFHYGVNHDWDTAAALHTGTLLASPFQMGVVPPGQVTLLIKAVDTSGNESTNPAAIVKNLGDPTVANVVESFAQATAWSGTLVNGSIVSGAIEADQASSSIVAMWTADGNAMWTADGNLMWVAATFDEMTYEFTFTPSLVAAGSNLTLVFTNSGDAIKIEYRLDDVLMWASDAASFWISDTAAMWGTPSYKSWPGSVVAANEAYDIKVTTGAGSVQGKWSVLTPQIDVPDIEEFFSDVVLASGGTRLSLTETYAAIVVVNVTVQDDGGTAHTAIVKDKDITLGPLIQTLDAAGTGTAGTIDAVIQGY